MVDRVDQVNMNEEMLFAKKISVKVEQCQEDRLLEDKVDICESAITTDKFESQSPHGILNHYEDFECLDNIKRELGSFEVSELQDDVKTERGISGNIKIEFDNGLLYCEHCEAYYEDYCIECGMLVHVLNKPTLNNADKGARDGIPNDILEIQDCLGQTGIYALRIIPVGVIFGPFTGLSATECPWEMNEEKFILNKSKSKYLNWMQHVSPTKSICDQNMNVFKFEDNVYYQSTRQIQAGEELLVYLGAECENSPDKMIKMDFVTPMKDIDDIFACTFCCLGFNSRSHLAKHKTACVKDTVGKFSIEELTRCSFCKIHLGFLEYFKHHMFFCCERNSRKCIPPTQQVEQATTALNGRKRRLRHIYKCEQCKYRTKYQADLREHTNNRHYKAKMYKCRICNRRFITKESFRLHVKNRHASVGRKNDQKHSSTDDINTYIRVEKSSSRNQGKIFKCSLCVFRTKYTQALRKHIKTKHLEIYKYECEKCEYRTNVKNHIENHIKVEHLKKFDYKCDECAYKTNQKYNLDNHMKTKHLKLFDHKCHYCKFGSNRKKNLELHIKSVHFKEFKYYCEKCEFGANGKRQLAVHMNSKHLKTFDFKCDNCGYGTNNKGNLEKHIKSKHLKQFDYKCDKCEFGTNNKYDFKKHIKTIHSKEFDFKCDFCEFGTNSQSHLKYHLIHTKHLKEFDYKCDKCEFGTSSKSHLELHTKIKHLQHYKCDFCEFETSRKRHLNVHIKSKHLNQFDHKCDKCEFQTNSKNHLNKHIKSKHLKKFDFKCDRCEFGTNDKIHLEVHIKSKHLKEFDYKCDKCKFVTNRKDQLEAHIKTVHLKIFDFKCDKCEFETNSKSHLEKHIKAKHLKKFDYNCGKCGFGTNDKNDLEKHIERKHFNKIDCKYKCDKCEYATNIKVYLPKHIKSKH